MEIPNQAPVRLNVGCGTKKLEGYLGVDLNPEADVVADVKALPFEDNSVDEVLAVHVLEHLYRWEADAAIAEWRRVLKPGGLLAIEVPELKKVAHFMLHDPDPRMGLWGAFGDPGYKDPLMCHRWLYSAEELRSIMVGAGFGKAKEKPVQFHKPKRDMRMEAVK